MADQPKILGPDGRPVSSRAYKGVGGGSYGGRGGLRNPASGLGGANDKGAGSFFTPTRIYWRTPLEILYVQIVGGAQGHQHPGRRHVPPVARVVRR